MAGHGFVHGEVIALGTALMSVLQDNNPGRVRRILSRCRVDWRLDHLGVSRQDVVQTVLELPAFVREARLPYSIIDDAALSPALAEDALDRAFDGESRPS